MRKLHRILLLLVALSSAFGAGESLRADEPYTNRLIDSKNPYLLLHAHDPVDWYPWGPEALEKARAENKPIFLSVGYSTCYWCHIAQKTLYANPEIARLMNAGFVNIKVDREQRPDLDGLYQLATQFMIGRGGWPNNVFLTPDLKPFYAGSYFSVADDPARSPGFPTVLEAVQRAWMTDRQHVLNVAGSVYAALQRIQGELANVRTAPVQPERWLESARDALLDVFDPVLGGFSSGPHAPKFPSAPALEVLLARAVGHDDVQARQALLKTLDVMAAGGIHDHLAGGFHRYSTQPDWSVPHFEKMLYDNAQLLPIYEQAFQLSGDDRYRHTAERLGKFLLREMQSSQSGFFTALDAMVDYAEGRSYLWSREEIEQVLGVSEAADFFAVYSLVEIPPDAVSDGGGAGGGVLITLVPPGHSRST